jgi:hypothetical protein
MNAQGPPITPDGSGHALAEPTRWPFWVVVLTRSHVRGGSGVDHEGRFQGLVLGTASPASSMGSDLRKCSSLRTVWCEEERNRSPHSGQMLISLSFVPPFLWPHEPGHAAPSS